LKTLHAHDDQKIHILNPPDTLDRFPTGHATFYADCVPSNFFLDKIDGCRHGLNLFRIFIGNFNFKFFF
jgi:hypothetical protein